MHGSAKANLLLKPGTARRTHPNTLFMLSLYLRERFFFLLPSQYSICTAPHWRRQPLGLGPRDKLNWFPFSAASARHSTRFSRCQLANGEKNGIRHRVFHCGLACTSTKPTRDTAGVTRWFALVSNAKQAAQKKGKERSEPITEEKRALRWTREEIVDSINYFTVSIQSMKYCNWSFPPRAHTYTQAQPHAVALSNNGKL